MEYKWTMLKKTLFSLFLLNVVFRLLEASRLFLMTGDALVEQPEVCHDSADCPLGFSCRDSHGNIVDSSGTFDVIGPVIQRQNGTCSPIRAQYEERCNEFCPCDNGLECFHPLIGDKLVPMTCEDKQFVERGIEAFVQCYQNSQCELPLLPDSDS